MWVRRDSSIRRASAGTAEELRVKADFEGEPLEVKKTLFGIQKGDG
jgi:hypothetical protein